jgi:hypothetical protein
MKQALKSAHEEVEEEEDEHLYHTKGWARELWIESLGMPAVLPPPEEEKDVKDAISAARAEQSREKMLPGKSSRSSSSGSRGRSGSSSGGRSRRSGARSR